MVKISDHQAFNDRQIWAQIRHHTGLHHEAGWHWPRLHMILRNPAPWSQTHVDSAVLWLHVLDSKLHLLLPGAQCSLKASCASLTCGFIHAMLEHLKQSEISYSNSRGVKVWRSTCVLTIYREMHVLGSTGGPPNQCSVKIGWRHLIVGLAGLSLHQLWSHCLKFRLCDSQCCIVDLQLKRKPHWATEPCFSGKVSTKMYQVLLCHIFFTLKGLNLTLKNLLQVKYG